MSPALLPAWLETPIFSAAGSPITVGGLVGSAAIILLAYFVSWLVRRGVRRFNRRGRVDETALITVERTIHIFILLVATLMAIDAVGLDTTQFAVVGGALAVGLGFGLRTVLENLASGFILLYERSIRVGDMITLKEGTRGIVREINLRYTTVTTFDNVDVVIPNIELVSQRVENWTLRDPEWRLRVPFGVAYGSDPDAVRAAALEAVPRVPHSLKTNRPERQPLARMIALGESSLNWELLVWVRLSHEVRPVAIMADYLEALCRVLGDRGITIPYPQRDLHVKGLPPLEGR